MANLRSMMKAFYVLWLSMMVGQVGLAQSDSASISHTVHRSFADYDEEILYFGKRDQYFTVRTLLKNGSLVRLDSYTLLPKQLAGGFQLDSVSRIIRHGPTKIMYPTGQVYISCAYDENLLHGPFMVLYEDGATKRRAYYRHGYLKKSECYTPDGIKQACAPFYQAAEFQGETKELSAYLKQKLETVVDGERIRSIRATLTINEIGQIIKVRAVVNGDQTDKGFDAVNYVQQVIRNMPEWTPDKLNWKPAVYDGVATSSTCIMSIFRQYGSIEYRLFYRM